MEIQEKLVVELKIPSQYDRLKILRAAIHRAAESLGCSADTVEELVLALNEACMNVIQHAYHDAGNGEVVLRVYQEGDTLLFRLIDFSDPVDVSKIRPRDLDDIRPGGLGTHFINEIMDEVHYLPLEPGRGNILEMRKKIG